MDRGEDMPDKRLHDLLQALHEELNETQRLDPGVEKDLRAVMHDIRGALERVETQAHEREGLRARLSEQLERFEEDHPRLALTVRRVIDTMSRLT
jgi:signal transduction histidine kinase